MSVRTPLHLLLVAVLLAAPVVLLAAAPALAHTELVGSSPAGGSSVVDPPTEVVLTFSQAPSADVPVEVEVIDPNGDDLVSAPPTVDGAVVTVPLNLAVTPGVHTVRYALVAQDGDRQVEELSFTFDPPASVATPTETFTPPGTDASSSPPPPTVDPTAPTDPPVATPSPTPTPTTTATEADLLLGDGGSSPLLGVVVGALAVAAVGAVVLRRVRDADQDG